MNSRTRFSSIDARFGVDRALAVATDCHDLNAARPLIVGTAATERRHGDLLTSLDDLKPTLFLQAEAHSPAGIIDEATDVYRRAGCDSVITIGGGSSISIGKALAVSEKAVFIALPTTYSGSEATAIYGRRIDGEKRTAIDDRCRPSRVIYDPQLSRTLPVDLSVSSATNCMAHAVDALYAADAGMVTATLAKLILETLRNELPKLLHEPDNLRTREKLLVAGFVGGTLVSMHGIALHHQLCHVIGGLYGTPHGDNNAAVLPQAIAYNTGAVPAADELLAEVFEDTFPARSVFDFIAGLAGDTALLRFGMDEGATDAVTEKQLEHGGYNPRPLEYNALRICVHNALTGTRPTPESG